LKCFIIIILLLLLLLLFWCSWSLLKTLKHRSHWRCSVSCWKVRFQFFFSRFCFVGFCC
jgi:hypothetical protein